ncbi:MAG: type II toxin-antitoxin system prevent-host-death family antitoxin [Limisphaerales bacterium]
MNSIGLFEAKTKLSEICDAVATNGKAVTVTRRGRPLVTIEPIPAGKHGPRSVWAVRAEYERKHGRLKEAFELPVCGKQTSRNPLES